MMRITLYSWISLALVGCGPSPASTTATDASSGDTTNAGATSTGDTVTSDDTVTSGDTHAPTTGSGNQTLCNPNMDEPCAPGEICIEHFGGDYIGYTCVPNPDGCVPDFPCPPACQALCDQHFVGACPESNAGNPTDLLECPEAYFCDPFLSPDCPEGRKCTPSYVCELLVPMPAGVDEPCTPGSPDPCVAGTFCALPHLGTGTGTCFPLCTGSEDAPECAPERSCMAQFVDISEVFLCIPTCDPLAPECAEGDVCVPNPSDDSRFICTIDASAGGGALFTPCEPASGCDPGLFCGDSAAADECDENDPGCCLPYCDLTNPTCPGVGQACVPWFAMGEAPSGLEDVGRCALP